MNLEIHANHGWFLFFQRLDSCLLIERRQLAVSNCTPSAAASTSKRIKLFDLINQYTHKDICTWMRSASCPCLHERTKATVCLRSCLHERTKATMERKPPAVNAIHHERIHMHEVSSRSHFIVFPRVCYRMQGRPLLIERANECSLRSCIDCGVTTATSSASTPYYAGKSLALAYMPYAAWIFHDNEWATVCHCWFSSPLQFY
jgi:hypothetical protein